MAEDDDLNGAYNREPVFKGGNYTYWKESMYVHLVSVDKNLWYVVTEDHLFPREITLLLNIQKIEMTLKQKRLHVI